LDANCNPPGMNPNQAGMRYLLAILLPPVAVLLCGRPLQALLNLILTLCLWLPGAIHAVLVVNSYLEDKRADRIIDAVGSRRTA
jgi:uncharacterized membrane protein YqaE (UPF0057 family)